jgi:tRNA threonylcarbamoyladenosine biosynthesis protein TsaE
MIFDSNSVADTERIAADLARRFRGGECVALNGDLGAGKTQFVRGLVAALGGEARQVSSPTFVLMHIYDGERLRVYHLDAYRVSGADDFEGIGFSELIDDRDAVVVVEWADKVVDLLPAEHIDIRIESTGETSRRIEIVESPTNPRPAAAL